MMAGVDVADAAVCFSSHCVPARRRTRELPGAQALRIGVAYLQRATTRTVEASKVDVSRNGLYPLNLATVHERMGTSGASLAKSTSMRSG